MKVDKERKGSSLRKYVSLETAMRFLSAKDQSKISAKEEKSMKLKIKMLVVVKEKLKQQAHFINPQT